ncbi:GTPase regulator Nrf1 [Blomia tropicalis]|nr:GTPase regulator Nrf1 [Blomia tropicalis]
MNLIVCGSEPNASNDDNDNNNNNNTIIINNNPNNNNHHTHSNVLQYQSSDQSKINYLMKHKQEAMNHSDGGGGEIDDLSDDPSSPESDNFDDSDLLSSTAQDEVTAQLAAAGQQAVVLIVTPGKPQNNFKVFGARPLESVVRQCRSLVIQELESALAQHAPPQVKEDPSLHELPPLVVDGIPTPVEKMTQAQLRAFIPLMLKYSTGRGKPGWGKESTRPPWWPQDLPWANVRSDARNEEDKQKVSWTHALRQIVINCYKFHGREDLLPAFTEDDEKNATAGTSAAGPTNKEKVMKTNTNNRPGTVQHQQHHSINVTNLAANSANLTALPIGTDGSATLAAAQGVNTLYAQPITHYAPTMVQTINNPDGTVSIIQVDPSAVVAIQDGSGQTQVRTLSSLRNLGIQFQGTGNDANQGVQTLAEIATGQDHERVTQISTINVDVGDGQQQSVSLAEATIGPDGQIILTGEDGTQSTFPVSGMVTIPVSMYQTVVTNLNLQGETNIPIMSTISTANSNQLGDGATVDDDAEEVKCVLNGAQTSIRIATANDDS